MFSERQPLFVEALGHIPCLPTDSHEDVPNEFDVAKMWMDILGDHIYDSARAKAGFIKKNLVSTISKKRWIISSLVEAIIPTYMIYILCTPW